MFASQELRVIFPIDIFNLIESYREHTIKPTKKDTEISRMRVISLKHVNEQIREYKYDVDVAFECLDKHITPPGKILHYYM
jgi:hypothetical protein